MEKLPYGKYSKEFRLEAVRLMTEGGLSAGEAAKRLRENWKRSGQPTGH